MARKPTKDLPEPPIPKGADLRNFRFMMLDVDELLNGEATVDLDADAFRCLVRSFAVAWKEYPAGSLPSKPAMLAHRLNLRIEEFQDLRRRDGLMGWRAANDGRLYHEHFTAAVLNALERKRKNAEKTVAARAARAASRSQTKETSMGADSLAINLRKKSIKSTEVIESSSITGSVTDFNRSEENGIEGIAAAAASSTRFDPDVDEPMDLKFMPRLSDPEHLWVSLSGGYFGIDDEGKRRPKVKSYYLDIVCQKVCAAAGKTNRHWRGDFDTVARWLNDGLYPNTILDAIEARVRRKPYEPPARLRYFNDIVRDYAAAHPGRGKPREAA